MPSRSSSLTRALMVLLVGCLTLPLAAKTAADSVWTHKGSTWSNQNLVSLTVPDGFKVTPDSSGLLSVEDSNPNFWVGYALTLNKKDADKFLKSMKKHLKTNGELKLGKVARITSNPKLHLVAREGVVKMNKTDFSVAMGYFTNKNEYLSFLVFYPADQKSKYEPQVVKLMNSIGFK